MEIAKWHLSRLNQTSYYSIQKNKSGNQVEDNQTFVMPSQGDPKPTQNTSKMQIHVKGVYIAGSESHSGDNYQATHPLGEPDQI